MRNCLGLRGSGKGRGWANLIPELWLQTAGSSQGAEADTQMAVSVMKSSSLQDPKAWAFLVSGCSQHPGEEDCTYIHVPGLSTHLPISLSLFAFSRLKQSPESLRDAPFPQVDMIELRPSSLLAPAFSIAAVLPTFCSKILLVYKTFTTKEPDL